MRILVPGRNCWIANAEVESCGVLVDGRDYYCAFHHAARAAGRSILIAGWKFNSKVRLVRGSDGHKTDGNVRFLPFLKELCDQNPDLHVYILAWDYSPIYSLQWEWFLDRKFNHAHERIHFRFDNHHAFGGSHHQKFVVIDGHIAFVGGLDFNYDDWDDRDHLPENKDRADAEHTGHGPYHDAQVYLVGAAAQELTGYFQKRWQEATNTPLHVPAPLRFAAVPGGLPIAARHAALSCNEPMTQAKPESVLQIRDLYRDAIAAAQRLIYIENQYFTSSLVQQALIERMRRRDGNALDIVLVLPKEHAGWLETAALEPPRLRLLQSLIPVAKETGHRLGIYYSAAAGRNGVEVPTLIHSKLLIIDDRFLTIGSANTSNRSMGLDTELNVSWETLSRDELSESIRHIRINLLSEHCGFRHCAELEELERTDAVVDSLDRLIENGSCRLRRLTPQIILHEQKWLAPLARWGFSLDPERPILDEILAGF